MAKISAAVAPDQRLIRTIRWTSNTHQNVTLPVTLEFAAPQILREEHERKRDKVVGVRKLTPMEDVGEISKLIEQAWQEILAERIISIGELTFRKLSYMLSLDRSKVADLDAPIELDTADQTPLSEEDQKDYGPAIKTKGEAARDQIKYLLRVYLPFRQFVESVITDVSWFQDDDWESQAKNS